MSGHQQNHHHQQQQSRRSWSRGPPSPIYYRPPSPWAPSPPPIISGPQPQFNSHHSPRSTPISPMFGTSPGSGGLRGRRGPHVPYPTPQWPTSPSPGPYQQQHQLHQPQSIPVPSRVSPSPIPVGVNGPKPYKAPFNPIHANSRPSPIPVICQTPPEYLYSGPQYEFIGAPMEPPQPKSYIIYDDEEEQGPSTAEIIANQSQDYVDERLAEYQMTIAQLQGEYNSCLCIYFIKYIGNELTTTYFVKLKEKKKF